MIIPCNNLTTMLSVQVGAIAEKKFELKALKLQLPISKPLVDVNGYDYIIQKGGDLVKIQVKSTTYKSETHKNPSYKVSFSSPVGGYKYTSVSFDYLVVYIFDLRLWFIIPYSECSKSGVRLCPNSKISKYNKYKEAWNLLL